MALAMALGGESASAQSFFQTTTRTTWNTRLGTYYPQYVNTITFTEVPVGTVLTDQYNDGLPNPPDFDVTFVGGNDQTVSFAFPDTRGVRDTQNPSGPIILQFDSPQSWIGVHYDRNNSLRLRLLEGSPPVLVYDSGVISPVSSGFWGVSANNRSTTFDRAEIGVPGSTLTVDDIVFGAPPPPKYFAFNLGVPEGFDSSRANAISRRGHLVGMASLDEFPFDEVAVAFRMFSEGQGQPAGVVQLSGSPSVANDINRHGTVVGTARPGFVDRAFMWDLATLDATNLGGFDSIYNSEAHGVNDDIAPIIVGRAEDLLAGCEANKSFYPTWMIPGQQLEKLPFLPAGLEIDTAGIAHDVDLIGLVVGGTFDCALDVNCLADLDPDAVEWFIPMNVTELPWFGLGEGPPALARGINECGLVCGEGRLVEDEQECPPHAVGWFEDGQDLDLHLEVGLEPDDQSIANALTNVEMLDGMPTNVVEVAGRHITLDRAYVWRREANGEWSVIDIYQFIDTPCPPFCPGWIDVRETTDINDDGWLSAFGTFATTTDHTGPSAQRAALVKPATYRICWPDFNGDGIIGPPDLGELLATWGPCNPADIICRTDIAPTNAQTQITGDGHVGPPDLGNLLAAWGVCRCGAQSGGSESWGPGGDFDGADDEAANLALTEVVTSLGFASAEQFLDWSETATDAEILLTLTLVEALYGSES